MEPLKPYPENIYKKDGIISFFNKTLKELEQHGIKNSDTYDFPLFLPLSAKRITCYFLRPGCINNEGTLDFKVTEARAAK